MRFYNIYYVGSEESYISSIFLDHLIKFSKKSKKFKLLKIISFRRKNDFKISKLKIICSYIIYFLFNREYYKRLIYLNSVKSKYKNISNQASTNKISCIDFNKFKNLKSCKSSILISCGSPFLSEKIINKFYMCINYHHANLPQFRGVNSNGLELFSNSQFTFYSWHFINKEIDKGYVFFKEKFKIKQKITNLIYYDIKKITKASLKIEKILYRAKNLNYKKNIKTKSGNYYSAKYFKHFCNNFENFTYSQLAKFIKIFGGINYRGKFVTKIKRSKDGILIKNSRVKILEIRNLPILVYRSLNFFKLIN